MQTITIPLVRQVCIYKGKQCHGVSRYDFKTETVFYQNRSKDFYLSKSDYLFQIANKQTWLESQGYRLVSADVPAGSLWPKVYEPKRKHPSAVKYSTDIK